MTTRSFVSRTAVALGGSEVLAGLGTRDVARDLDVLRAVLGDEKLTFRGQSYGTRGARDARDTCEHRPAKPTLGFPYADAVEGLPGTLVVSITGDPTTPHAGGIKLAEALGSRLTVEGEGHTVVAGGKNDCVNGLAAAYPIELELPGDGATCTL